MKNSACLFFPFKTDNETDALKRADNIEDIILSCIRMYLVTKRGSKLGNMDGCILPDLLLNLMPTTNLDANAKELKTDLTKEFQGIDFLDVSLTLDLSYKTVDLIVKISLTSPIQDNVIELSHNFPTKFNSNSFQ